MESLTRLMESRLGGRGRAAGLAMTLTLGTFGALAAPPAGASPAEAAPRPVPLTAKRALARGISAVKSARSPADLEKAERAFQQAERHAPWWPNPAFNLGLVLEAQGKIQAAIGAFSRFLRLAPGGREAHWLRTQKLPALRSWSTRRSAATELIKRGIKSLRTGRRSRAKLNFMRAIARAPEDAGVRAWVGYAYYQAKRYKDAIPELVHAIKLGDRRLIVYSALAWSYYHLGDPGKAVRTLERGLAVNSQASGASKAKRHLQVFRQRRGKVFDLERRIGPLGRWFHINVTTSLLSPNLGDAPAALVQVHRGDSRSTGKTGAGWLLTADLDFRSVPYFAGGIGALVYQTRVRQPGRSWHKLSHVSFYGSVKFTVPLTPRIELRGGLLLGLGTYSGTAPLYLEGAEVPIGKGMGVMTGLFLEVAWFFEDFDWLGLLFKVGVVGSPFGYVHAPDASGEDVQYRVTTPPFLFFGIGFDSALL